MAEGGVQENEEAGHFGVQGRATLDALKWNRWFLVPVESPTRLHVRQQEEKMLVGFKKFEALCFNDTPLCSLRTIRSVLCLDLFQGFDR